MEAWLKTRLQRIKQRSGKARTEEGREELEREVAQVERALTNIGMGSFIENVVKNLRLQFMHDDFGELLDSDRYLIAFENGLYDFRTWSFRPIEPEDCIGTTVGYDFTAHVDEAIKKEIEKTIQSTQPSQEDAIFVMRMLSLGIFWNMFEVIVVMIGGGRNGKGLIMKLFIATLGSSIKQPGINKGYHTTMEPTALTLEKRGQNEHDDWGKTMPKRAVSMTEPSHTQTLKTSKVNQITGGDAISSRGPYGAEPIEFVPRFVPYIQCNTAPKADLVQQSLKSRLVMMHFPYTFVSKAQIERAAPARKPWLKERDIQIKDKFENDIAYRQQFMPMLIDTLEGLLNKDPAIKEIDEIITDFHRRRTKTYFYTSDPIELFIEECLQLTGNPYDTLRACEVVNAFDDFLQVEAGGEIENGHETIRGFKSYRSADGQYAKQLKPKLEAVGLEQKRMNKGMVWVGVKFKVTN